MASPESLKEYIPPSGYLFQEFSLHPILCKPKLLPLKSMTLERLEKMQKEANDKVMEVIRARPSTSASTGMIPRNDGASAGATDVWRPEDESEEGEQNSARSAAD